MAALREDVKLFIVHALACFDTPSQVVEQVKEEFDIDVTRSQVQSYDPDKALGKQLSKKFVDEFRRMRETFLAEKTTIAIANKAYRLRALDRMSKKAEKAKNIMLAAELIQQAAKEVGDMYVNKNIVKPDGEQVQPATVMIGVKDASKPKA